MPTLTLLQTRYTLDDKRSKASETLAKREGMCTNKANLQVSIWRAKCSTSYFLHHSLAAKLCITRVQIALLRATGVACGYRMVHVTKECFRSPKTLPELFEKIHEPTVITKLFADQR